MKCFIKIIYINQKKGAKAPSFYLKIYCKDYILLIKTCNPDFKFPALLE